jgi:hypothetical protein
MDNIFVSGGAPVFFKMVVGQIERMADVRVAHFISP